MIRLVSSHDNMLSTDKLYWTALFSLRLFSFPLLFQFSTHLLLCLFLGNYLCFQSDVV